METDLWICLSVMEGRGRSRKQLKETGVYWILEVEAMERTVLRTRFVKGGLVVRQNTERINKLINVSSYRANFRIREW